uniref:Uncharacterized protein n=1 Tax=Myripristis murdjan TaxID=586833 RepID=A0A667YPC2_9TELE
MKSCQSLKEEVSVPSLDGMSQEEGRRAQVSQSYFHSPTADLDLTGKLYKREVGGKPYSVLVDNKMAAKTSMGDQNLGQEGGAVQEVGAQGSQAGNGGTSEDTEEDDEDEEEEGEDEDGEEEEGFKREQIIVEVNLNNQTLHVSKGDKTTGPAADDSERAGSDDDDEEEEEEDEEEEEEDIAILRARELSV